MECAFVSSCLLSSSKTIIKSKPFYANPFPSHFSQIPLNRTLQTTLPSSSNSIGCLSLPLSSIPVPTIPISRRRQSGVAFASNEGGETASASPPDAIVLNVEGMMCGGCTDSVKRILESQPQVSSASVNLETKSAVVMAMPEIKVTENWQQQLGETLANHLTTCGFKSSHQGFIE